MTTYGSAIDGVATNVTTETKTVQVGRTRVYGVHVSGPNQAGVLELSDGSTSKVKLNGEYEFNYEFFDYFLLKLRLD